MPAVICFELMEPRCHKSSRYKRIRKFNISSKMKQFIADVLDMDDCDWWYENILLQM